MLVGVAASLLLLSFYIGIMSVDGGLALALRELGREWWLISGIGLAFGAQVALYAQVRANNRALRMQATNAVGVVSATTSAGSMLACCLHHATDVLPFLGLTALGTFFGQYRAWFFGLAYVSSAVGLAITLRSLKHQRIALNFQRLAAPAVTSISHGSR